MLTVDVPGTTINKVAQIWKFPRKKSQSQDRKEKELHNCGQSMNLNA
jgi:hypothetical protein